MAKAKIQYSCTECGAVSQKWSGKCNDCNSWNTIEEVIGSSGYSKAKPSEKGKIIDFFSLEGKADNAARFNTNIDELNRVLGGGLVKGSAVLIGGDPGIGKSTILLQVMAKIADSGLNAAYITGEESIDQIRLRAKRLNVTNSPIKLASATNVSDIIATLNKEKPDVVVIDSIQTMFINSIESAPGTVSQVRMSAYELINMAKQNNIAIILVGHVTKEGQIAGPKVLEHMVDTTLYFEGDRGHQFRILRSVKNRYGAANEIGVFEMTGNGLSEVTNPSSLFISGTAGKVSGSVVFPGIEGSRTVMVEIQALVSPSTMPTPRRAVVGWDSNRLAMILAVLQTRCGVKIADKEVYLNVAGGIKISEPAADVAVAAALISALSNVPFAADSVVFGELGLSGEIRPVSQFNNRLKEAEKLGFTSAIMPKQEKKNNKLDKNQNNDNFSGSQDFIIKEIQYISQLKEFLAIEE